MRNDERGKASRVIVLALLCASGASVPVVALRPPLAVEIPAPMEQPLVYSLAAPGANLAFESIAEEAPAIAAMEVPIPESVVVQSTVSLDDRLRSFFMG
jgi:hypothetical protein